MKSFLVSPTPRRDGSTFVQVQLRSEGTAYEVYLPSIPGLRYRIVPRSGQVLSVESSEATITERTGARALLDTLGALRFRKRKKYLKFESCIVVPHGAQSERRAFYAVNKQLRRSQYALDGDVVRRHRELVLGSQSLARPSRDAAGAPAPADAPPDPPRFAVVVHVFYLDIWTEIAAVLRSLPQIFDVHVTTPLANDLEKIRAEFPRCQIHVFENRGRDIAPFLALLESGVLDHHEIICKLHTKKSADGGRNPILGAVWRYRLLFELVARPDITTRILSRFADDDRLGVVGCGAYRFPNATCNEEISWGQNRPGFEALCERMGVAKDAMTLDFFCGSMFWVRRSALEPLRHLRLLPEFAEERGSLDGELEHIVERLFTTSAVLTGFSVQSVEDLWPVASQRAG